MWEDYRHMGIQFYECLYRICRSLTTFCSESFHSTKSKFICYHDDQVPMLILFPLFVDPPSLTRIRGLYVLDVYRNLSMPPSPIRLIRNKRRSAIIHNVHNKQAGNNRKQIWNYFICRHRKMCVCQDERKLFTTPELPAFGNGQRIANKSGLSHFRVNKQSPYRYITINLTILSSCASREFSWPFRID